MPGFTFTLDDLKARLERLTGRSLRFGRFPWWALLLAAPCHERSRDMTEMRYLYRRPHKMAGDNVARLLPDFRPTPLDTVIKKHLTALKDG